MEYYAKSAYTEEPPTMFKPTPVQMRAARQKVLAFIDIGKKSSDEIEKYLLVELGYGASYGATGNHVKDLLDDMVKQALLKVTSGLFVEEPVIEEIV